ncbi:MAG TPA: hypothetical protein PLJ40_04285 [Paludibacteraceae bacterium]|nr:hypothetical protein [Paludibacteraceae bacterium]HQB69545.1 hypothetical protein [Paludibacteraceae bacterium]
MATSFISPTLVAGESNIIVRKSKKTTVNALTLIVVSIICAVAITMLPESANQYISVALGLLAGTLLIVGILKLSFGRKTYIYKPTNSKLEGRVFFCTAGKGQESIAAIKAKKWAQLGNLISQNETGVKLEFVTSKDRQFARCQVLTFIPYNFEPLSDVIVLSADDIEQLLTVTNTKI